MKRIVVVMTYFNREAQLLKTLGTIVDSGHDNYHVVIVDDGSEKPLVLDMPHGPRETTVIRIEPEEKKGPYVVPFNVGIGYSFHERPDIIIMQNAECYHMGDVLMYANDHVSDNQGVSFACWNEEGRIADVMEAIRLEEEPGAREYGTGWYNHRINARGYHFCNAYSRLAMIALNGMDERFMGGIGHDDDDLVRRQVALRLAMPITDETLPFVVHAAHERVVIPPEDAARNQALFYKLKTVERNNFRARHLVTPSFNMGQWWPEMPHKLRTYQG
jgi:hypothetical protein